MTNKSAKNKGKNGKQDKIQVDPKFQEKIDTVSNFTNWKSKEDIAKVLEDTGHDVEKAVQYILEGISKPTVVEDWQVVSRKKEKTEGTKPAKEKFNHNKKSKDNRNKSNQPPRQQQPQAPISNTPKESQTPLLAPVSQILPETKQALQTEPELKTEKPQETKQAYRSVAAEEHTKTFLQAAQDSVTEHTNVNTTPETPVKQDSHAAQDPVTSQRTNNRNQPHKPQTNVPNTTVESQPITRANANPISPPKTQVAQQQQPQVQQNPNSGSTYSYKQNYSKQAWKPKEPTQNAPTQTSSAPSQVNIPKKANVQHSEMQNKTPSNVPSASAPPISPNQQPTTEKIVQTSDSSVNASPSVSSPSPTLYSNSPVILPTKAGLDFQNQFPQFNFGSLTSTDYDGSYNPSELVAMQQARNGQVRYMESHTERQDNTMKTSSIQGMPQLDSESHPAGVIPPGYTYVPHGTGFIPSGPSGVVYPPYFDADSAMRPMMLNQAPFQPPGYPQREQASSDSGKFTNSQRTGNQSANFTRDGKFQDGNTSQAQNTVTPQQQQPGAPIPGQHPYGPYSSHIYAYPPYIPNQYPSYQTPSQYAYANYLRGFANYSAPNSGGYPPQQVPNSPANSQIGGPSFGTQDEMNLNQEYKFPVAPNSYFPSDPSNMMPKIPQQQGQPQNGQGNKPQNFSQGNGTNELSGTSAAQFKNNQQTDFSKGGYGNYYVPPFGGQPTNGQRYPTGLVYPPNPNQNPNLNLNPQNFSAIPNSGTNARQQSTPQTQGQQTQGNTYLTPS